MHTEISLVLKFLTLDTAVPRSQSYLVVIRHVGRCIDPYGTLAKGKGQIVPEGFLRLICPGRWRCLHLVGSLERAAIRWIL
jgi:hypothetical protein